MEICQKGLFVKINMDGIPIGRKVDLKAYGSYDKLSSVVDQLFRGLLAAQNDPSTSGHEKKEDGEKAISGLLDGSGEYTLVYEDNEGDRMPCWGCPLATGNASSPMPNETVGSSSASGTSKKPAADELIEDKSKASIQHGSSHKKGVNPPLDRIHLETLKGTSTKSGERETNPFLAFLKACVTTFVNFGQKNSFFNFGLKNSFFN